MQRENICITIIIVGYKLWVTVKVPLFMFVGLLKCLWKRRVFRHLWWSQQIRWRLAAHFIKVEQHVKFLCEGTSRLCSFSNHNRWEEANACRSALRKEGAVPAYWKDGQKICTAVFKVISEAAKRLTATLKQQRKVWSLAVCVNNNLYSLSGK